MTPYGNSSGKSGVRAYEISRNSITVEFISGDTYLYSHKKPGKTHVDKMIALAKSGKGLSTYISRHVKFNYEARW